MELPGLYKNRKSAAEGCHKVIDIHGCGLVDIQVLGNVSNPDLLHGTVFHVLELDGTCVRNLIEHGPDEC